jgi:hypothetical protein
MHSVTENIGALVLDDLVVDPITGLPEDADSWTQGDPDPQSVIRGLRNSLALSLLLWAVIVLTLVELF